MMRFLGAIYHFFSSRERKLSHREAKPWWSRNN